MKWFKSLFAFKDEDNLDEDNQWLELTNPYYWKKYNDYINQYPFVTVERSK